MWERSVKYNFGGDSISSAIVTATFLLGLGVGAVLSGRWRPHPFAVFALVEALLGLYAIASYHVLAPLATILGRLFQGSIANVEGLKSLEYFRKIRRILKPSGVFVYHGNYANAREAILAGLTETFPHVREHASRVVYASEQPFELDRARVEAVLTPRAGEIGLAPPYADWMLTDWHPIARHQFGVRAIRDNLLIYEYQFDPLAPLLGGRPRRGVA